MRSGNVSDLPANSDASCHKDGGVYRAILESSGQGFCTIEVAFDENERPVDYRFLEVSSSFERQTGIENAAGRWMREIAPNQDQFWFDTYGRVALGGEPERFENFSTPLDRWWSVYAFKIEGPARIAVLFHDITARKRAERDSVSRRQQYETLLNQAPLGVYLVDSDFVIREVNPVALPVFGDIPGGAVGRDFDEVIHILWDKEYADEVVRIFRHTLETGEPYVTPERAEYRVDRDIIEYYEWRLDRISLPGGQHGVVCYFRDISVQVNARMEIEKGREFARESERRQGMLLAELQHRVRNILAMIQSLVRRTADTSESPEEYARHLAGRISAMARTQTMLTRGAGRRVDLEEVLRDELLSVAASDEKHWCEGPDVALPPKAAEVFTLAIHELATNSVKYGALSTPGGQLEICWNLEQRDGQQWLVFEWAESRVRHGGFAREGFGTELITRRIPYELRGEGSIEPAANGMIARIEFPLVRSNSILETDMPEQLR